MAITQVANPSSVPSAVADYEAQNAHISAFNMIVNNQPFILTNSENTSLPAIAIGSYIQFGGNLYIVDTEDYAITGTPVDGNNYIRLSGTTTLTAEWIQDISSYVWNPVYGYKYTGSYAILPYLVVKASTAYYKTFINFGLGLSSIYASGINGTYSTSTGLSEDTLIPFGAYYLYATPTRDGDDTSIITLLVNDNTSTWVEMGKGTVTAVSNAIPISQIVISDGTNVKVTSRSATELYNLSLLKID